MRRAAPILAALLAIPLGGSAQVALQIGGGVALPVADFGDVADLGYQGSVGGAVRLGGSRTFVRALGFYGRNPHEIEGERSELYGLTVLAGYELGEVSGLALAAWAGPGGTVHQRRSDTFPGLDASRGGLTLNAGLTVSRPVGQLGIFVSGLYSRGVGKLDTDSYPTEWLALSGGLEVPLGID